MCPSFVSELYGSLSIVLSWVIFPQGVSYTRYSYTVSHKLPGAWPPVIRYPILFFMPIRIFVISFSFLDFLSFKIWCLCLDFGKYCQYYFICYYIDQFVFLIWTLILCLFWGAFSAFPEASPSRSRVCFSREIFPRGLWLVRSGAARVIFGGVEFAPPRRPISAR